ncbi:alpha/beta fold hydrolase [Legionella bozemanae]|uniref:Proline iminopeptidase n=1 Tax=Legionella bozemanae TaxID=447 RepID=A0A0W0RT78_LEGBO|nr:alpha/beta fold hydrolase [Legionella bozemanae]KTC74271.1 proline iminopeptidase [Legionella bozemanae]STO33864.1 Proline iminopeptidase [Legionella bozemanae]
MNIKMLLGKDMPIERYPLSECHSSGLVKVSDDTYIYYEQRGNPLGPTVVYNHGGPGGSSSPENSQWFDPEYYNIILYDQRGTGRSCPSIESPEVDPKQFSKLTIDDMAADLENLRDALNISQWLVFGGSWGSTLSLYYAAKYPQRIKGVIVYGIFLNDPEEMSQYYDVKLIKERFPELGAEALDTLLSHAQSKGVTINPNSPQSLMDAYYQFCVNENDMKAQYLWTAFERFNDSPTKESLDDLHNPPEKIDPSDRTHAVFECILFRFAYHGFNLLDKDLLMPFNEIPIRIVQGLSDTEAPPIFAQKLVKTLLEIKPNLWYRFISGKHAGDSSEEMTQTLLDCTNYFKKEVGALETEQQHSDVTALLMQGVFASKLENKPFSNSLHLNTDGYGPSGP